MNILFDRIPAKGRSHVGSLAERDNIRFGRFPIKGQGRRFVYQNKLINKYQKNNEGDKKADRLPQIGVALVGSEAGELAGGGPVAATSSVGSA